MCTKGETVTCEYCGQSQDGQRMKCSECGGQLPKPGTQKPDRERYAPFPYNGYIVWPIRDFARRQEEYHFYLGERLIDVVVLEHELIREFVKEGETVMPLVWSVFLLQQGETEVLRVVEQNTLERKQFEIRLVEEYQSSCEIQVQYVADKILDVGRSGLSVQDIANRMQAMACSIGDSYLARYR